jgi:hypothetical protein
MSVNLILYSTSNCHLCEQAELLLKDCVIHNDIIWRSVEISEYPTFLNLYEIKIPVLKREDNDVEIAWPFTTRDIVSLIELI